jgi:hypothetical protein
VDPGFLEHPRLSPRAVIGPGARFLHFLKRGAAKKAIMAVVASILTAIYHMLKDGTMYKDLGRNHFDRRSSDQKKSSSQTLGRPWLRR